MFHFESFEWVKRGVGRPVSSSKKVPCDREFGMMNMFKLGNTMEKIGIEYGISRERVRQLLKKHFGITGMDGGASIKAEFNIAHRQKRLRDREESRYQLRFGCSKEEFIKINGEKWNRNQKRTLASRYYQQWHLSVHSRGILWEITFPDWVKIWTDSGKLHLRGPGKGYCMARYGDIGSYHKDNVYICTIGENVSDYHLIKSHQRMSVMLRRAKEDVA